jgi:hypothetical protein
MYHTGHDELRKPVRAEDIKNERRLVPITRKMGNIAVKDLGVITKLWRDSDKHSKLDEIERTFCANIKLAADEDFMREFKKSTKDFAALKDSKRIGGNIESCRKINLMGQVKQSFWQRMLKMKKKRDQIDEIDVNSKREEANKGSNADFRALSDVVDRQTQGGHPSQHLKSLDLSEDETYQPIRHGTKEIKSWNSIEEQDVAEKRIFRLRERKKQLEADVIKIKHEIHSILATLNQKESVETSRQFPFAFGPVGDSPLHCCFLLGLHDLGFEIIELYYKNPELLSIPYENDLDQWRTAQSPQRNNSQNSSVVLIPERKVPDNDDNSKSDELDNNDESQESDKQLQRQPDYDETASDESEPLDDGLYTGETILHIAIVQEKTMVVQELLERGIELSTRAKGVFFQPRFQLPRTTELNIRQKIKARVMGINLKLERFAAVKRIENTYSGCYYGEYPLSFAASVGNVDICDLLYCYWQQRVRSVLEKSDHSNEMQTSVEKYTDEVQGESLAEGGPGLKYETNQVQNVLKSSEDKTAVVNFRDETKQEHLGDTGSKYECKITDFEKKEILKIVAEIRKSRLDLKSESEPVQMFRNNSFVKRNSHMRIKFDPSKEGFRNGGRVIPSGEPEEKILASFDREEALHQLMWNFVNAADSFGNTAMHMAVMHEKKDVIDWLMKIDDGKPGKDSLEMLNHEGFTPFTLAARYGKVEIFHHILYQHMSDTDWTYGKVAATSLR